MIKGSATIQFGSGSVASVYGVDKDTGFGTVFMTTIAPGKIELDSKRVDNDFVINNHDVAIYFTNVESLDMEIKCLTELREFMVEYKRSADEV